MDGRLSIDTTVLLIYFVGIIALGLWAGRRNRNLEDFSLGSRSIPWWAVLASIVAAETSAATFLGTPAEGFKTRGYFYGQLAIGTVLARIIIAFTFIKPYYDYRVQSVYEFLTIRFGTRTKNMASGIFLFTRVLGIGVRLYLGGAIMVVIWRYLFPETPINLNTYVWGIIFVTVITTVYTAIGGIKAVVWTDLIQAVLMISSVGFAIFLLLRNIPGGLDTVKSNLGGNVKLFQTGWDSTLPFGQAFKAMLEEPYTIFAAFIGSTLLTMGTHGTDQDMVQRMLTAPDHRKSQLSLILSGLMDLPIAGAFLTVGILLSVYYSVHPQETLPAADNEIFGQYIVHHMPVVFRGLIVAGVFATMMGSTSAALNALATSFTKDFYLPYIRPGATDRQAIRAARIATAVFGILMILVATVAANAVLQDAKLTIIPIAIGILGYTYGALVGVFLLGMVTRRRGADVPNVVAMALGILSVLILCKVSIPAFDMAALLHGKLTAGSWNFGWFMPTWWPAISWPWFVFVGCTVTFSIAILFRTPDEQIAAAEAHVARSA